MVITSSRRTAINTAVFCSWFKSTRYNSHVNGMASCCHNGFASVVTNKPAGMATHCDIASFAISNYWGFAIYAHVDAINFEPLKVSPVSQRGELRLSAIINAGKAIKCCVRSIAHITAALSTSLHATSFSSGQIEAQSFGLRSFRVTCPLVACSIAAQRPIGTGRSLAH
jgi:hypothetical protein